MTSIAKRPLLIGITGNIGSGKSTFCRYLESLNLRVIEADKLANNCLQDNEVVGKLVERYSAQILLNSESNEATQIDRAKLAERVFSDPIETAYLNALIHPRVLKAFSDIVKTTCEEYLGFEVPLLFEAELQECFDYLVLVYTPREYRIERLDQRGMTLPSILDREQRQIPDEEKLNKVDLVVANTGSALALKEKAGELVRSLRDIPYRQLKSFV